MDMVERVARAAKEAYRHELVIAPSKGAGDRAWLAATRAAIEAMREPTVNMKWVGATAWKEEKPPDYIYRAMIDAALVQAVNASDD